MNELRKTGRWTGSGKGKPATEKPNREDLLRNIVEFLAIHDDRCEEEWQETECERAENVLMTFYNWLYEDADAKAARYAQYLELRKEFGGEE